jgi:hypothetical protein
MPEEDLETSELKEHIDEDLERDEEEREHEHAPAPAPHGAAKGKPKPHAAKKEAASWTRYLSLSTAIIAVFAAVASLESGSNSNEAILAKSEAMLDQSQASDQWSLFEAKSIKATLTEADKPRSDGYRREGEKIQAAAQSLEDKVKEDNGESEHLMERHHKFAVSVTLLQIAIALSAIAALTRRKPLWFVGMAVSLAGVVMFGAGLGT